MDITRLQLLALIQAKHLIHPQEIIYKEKHANGCQKIRQSNENTAMT